MHKLMPSGRISSLLAQVDIAYPTATKRMPEE